MVSEKSGKKLERWEGSNRIVVEKVSGGRKSRSDICIVNLRDNTSTIVGGEILNHGGELTAVDEVVYAIGKPNANIMVEAIEDPDKQDIIHSTVSFLDVSTKNMTKWKGFEKYDMIDKGRLSPLCVSLKGKIFVFGGYLIGGPSSSFGEFFDTKDESQGWRPVPVPPLLPVDLDYLSRPVISDPVNDRLICHFALDSSLCAYYPSKSLWVCIARYNHPVSDPFSGGHAANTLVENVIYFYDETEGYEGFSAYDISTNEKLDLTWSAHTPFSPTDVYDSPFYNFVYLGPNILCYTTISRCSDRSWYRLLFFRFRATRVSPQSVTLTPLSSHSIPIEGLPYPVNFLPIQVAPR